MRFPYKPGNPSITSNVAGLDGRVMSESTYLPSLSISRKRGIPSQ